MTKRKATIRVSKLPDLQPTDILVFSVPLRLTEKQKDELASKIKEMLDKREIPNRHIVLVPGLSLSVIRLDAT